MNKILRPKSLIAALAVSAGFLGTQAAVASASAAPVSYCDQNYCYSTGGWTVTPPTAPVLAPTPAPTAPTTYCTPFFCFTI